MKCEKCGAEWNSNISKRNNKCPFCREFVTDITPYKTVTDALSMITERFGKEIYLEENRLYGLLNDILPNTIREKKILKNAIYLGIPAKVLEVNGKILEKNEILKDCYVAIENNGMSAEWCAAILYMFCCPLGIDTTDVYPLKESKTNKGIRIKKNTNSVLEHQKEVDDAYDKKSLEELIDLSEQGDDVASIELGERYYSGIGVNRDGKKALRYFNRASAMDNPVAQFYVGKINDEGTYVEHNPHKAIEFYTKSAKQGYPPAEFALGEMYYFGQGCDKNDQEAVYWISKAEKEYEDTNLYITLSMIYRESEDESVNNPEKAFLYAQKAADAGNATGYNLLGMLYELGCGVEQNYEKAFNYYLEAANGGVEIAYLSVGAFYQNGYWVKKDERKAVEYFQLGANVGNMYCLNALAMCYKNGTGVTQNYEKAFELFLESAYAGNFAGEYNVALAYDEGQGVEEDKTEAKKWFVLSAEKGFSKAMMALGFFAEKGIPDGEPNINEAFEWYLKAAEVGDNGLAQWIIGNCRSQGLMNSYVDRCEGFLWYLEAANNGHPTAQNNVACEYLNGVIIDQDYDLAVEWFEEATKQGDMYALNNYGTMLLNGNGVERNVERGFLMIKNSAEQGYSDAILNLGICYFEGWGTQRNLDEALRYLSESYNTGNEVAKEYLQKGFKEKNGKWIKKGLFGRVPAPEPLAPVTEIKYASQGCLDFCKYANKQEDEERCYCRCLGMEVLTKKKCPYYEDLLAEFADLLLSEEN